MFVLNCICLINCVVCGLNLVHRHTFCYMIYHMKRLIEVLQNNLKKQGLLDISRHIGNVSLYASLGILTGVITYPFPIFFSGMPGTFSPPPWVSDPDMHHGTCMAHVPWCLPGSLTSSFLWSRWREKRSRCSQGMRNPQFYVPDKRPIHHIHYHLLAADTVQYVCTNIL